MKNKKITLKRVLKQSYINLNMWLKRAGVETVEEFNLKKIILQKTISYHAYHDVIDHLAYIKRLEEIIETIEKQEGE